MDDCVVLSAARTPIGRFQGRLAQVPAPALGAAAVRAAWTRAGIAPEELDEVALGQVVPAGTGQHPARIAALAAGVPDPVPAWSVNEACGSGLKAVALVAQGIRLGERRLACAGGMESMSLAPHLVPAARAGLRFGDAQLQDSLMVDGLVCATEHWPMGRAAEHIARRFGITRGEQDRYAAESHARALAAWDAGRMVAEVAAVTAADGSVALDRDEGPRRDSTPEKLATLKPAFEAGGTVTAGNAASLNDGAAALVLASAEEARRRGTRPLARIAAFAEAFVAPRDLFWAPVPAIRACLAKAGWSLADVDLLEVNEAFAAQILADGKELGWDRERLNVNGGAIALGHPLGASGARVAVTLLHEMARRAARRGLAALCLGGGGAVAMAFERPG